MNPFSTPRRRVAWLVAAAVGVVLLDRAWAPEKAPDVTVVGAVNRDRRPAVRPDAGAAQGGPPAELERIARWQRARVERATDADTDADTDTDTSAVHLDPFAPVAWAPAPASAPRVPPPPPAPPVAPPFPYVYIGAMSEAGQHTLFFAKGERVLVVKVGDVVDSVYRIDEIDDKQMKLTFVPMNQGAVIAFGGLR